MNCGSRAHDMQPQTTPISVQRLLGTLRQQFPSNCGTDVVEGSTAQHLVLKEPYSMTNKVESPFHRHRAGWQAVWILILGEA